MKNVFPYFCTAFLTGCAVTVFSAFSASFLRADVRLPEVIASNMVLQRDLPVPIWGWADSGEKVTVSFAGQTQSATADAEGRWMVQLLPLQADSKPSVLTVTGKNELKLENILVGEVWLCSGQSNMEWTMARSAEYQDALKTVNNPDIRLFQVAKAWNVAPQDSLQAKWTPCDTETIPSFSAVGYYFGKRIQEELGVPVGLVHSSWGGTRIEPWTPPVGFQAVPTLKNLTDELAAKDPASDVYKKLAAEALASYKAWVAVSEKNLTANNRMTPPPVFPPQIAPYTNQQQPATLYNAMIHPLVPFAMRGAIWYQGESNVSEGMLYAEKMKALISGWRTVFHNPDFGFYYVQLAPFTYGGDRESRLPELWEAQSSVEKSVPKTGQAIITDLVTDIKDIHPPRKLQVGNRLALLALKRTYGKNLAAESPELDSMTIDGATLVLRFKYAEQLKTRDGQAPDWFEIAGADGVYHKAEAKIAGTTIELTNPNVAKAYAVRYAWSETAEPNVQNEAGLQLGAFRAGKIPERSVFDELIPDAEKYRLVYSFDPTHPVLTDNGQRFVYTTDKSGEVTGKIKRASYFLYLTPKKGTPQYVFVTMPPLESDIAKLGVPVKASGARFQKPVSHVTVVSNVPGIETGTFAEGCHVEFWDCNYSQENAASVPGASNENYDFGDSMTTGNSPGYGCLQIHNAAKKQTILAFNSFHSGSNCDVGIGNNPLADGNQHSDWTFSKSAQRYNGGRFLILVETE
ncbi:MAG: sialate O-acetylesterase [Planctomycetaceae bacterium]|jgi:sialate O-acetylesterase|nr:sialate O-acetylesterase [Planctomycetaceae bacterium]